MPYYIGDVVKEEKRMIARTPEQFAKTGVDVKLNTEVETVDSDNGLIRLSNNTTMPYDMMVMATGSDAFMPDIPGVNRDGVFKLKNLTDAIRIKTFLTAKKCTKAVVVGAGCIAMEISEALTQRGVKTQIVYRGERPVRRWSPEFSDMVLEELTAHNVDFITHETPVAVEQGSDAFPLRLVTENSSLDADIILFALGVKPSTALARDMGLAIGSSGAIQVNFAQRTSREEVYAVGDCCEAFNRVSRSWQSPLLGDIANKQGRVAGATIGGHAMSFPGFVGAQSFKIFELDVGITGLTEDEARIHGFDPVCETISGTPIARSLNAGEKLKLKLIADRYTGKLLGAQAAGNGGAVSRINALSACLWSGITIDEVGYIDIAYSPYYGGPWDPIHIAAQSLGRKL